MLAQQQLSTISYTMVCTAWCYGNIFALANDGSIMTEKDEETGEIRQIGNFALDNWYKSLEGTGKRGIVTIDVLFYGFPLKYAIAMNDLFPGEELLYYYGQGYWKFQHKERNFVKNTRLYDHVV